MKKMVIMNFSLFIFLLSFVAIACSDNGDDASPTTFENNGPILVAPQAPVLASPPNGINNLSLSPTLSWNASSNATSYALQVSSNSMFSNYFINQSGLTNTFQQITGLSNSTTYYWRVSAVNAGGTSGWSAVWYFNTPIVYNTTGTWSIGSWFYLDCIELPDHSIKGSGLYKINLYNELTRQTNNVDYYFDFTGTNNNGKVYFNGSGSKISLAFSGQFFDLRTIDSKLSIALVYQNRDYSRDHSFVITRQ